MKTEDIKALLPYADPFLFVDEILHIDENRVKGTYTFNAESGFYKGHFKGNPVTPGVLLIEAMAQIGLVCLGIYILNKNFNKKYTIALTSTECDFIKPVYPGEKVTVVSEKMYFRFGKLKCKTIMTNEAGEEVCRGTIAGMIT
ncbi:hydroxymyristoyl-ACP dehydratase [Flavobacterium cyanobacteriorum]|uniref:Hydroxymyristoyl-ACP dehydratase n=1 Tax=Flavobacterium cyanobacteriorum TaxID=2022802 RepID=A0A255ZBK3_9FLAO|nr:hydroxymyristoyl-ACP dehydratase [Flavobacterium cyanobacteriorum]OYQ38294.1 hydroxymyristoyl-ACP dehydratase [Flavobacterium cyanobacteriorum]